MLSLKRYEGESIQIGSDVLVKLVAIMPGRQARLGIVAPRDVRIARTEIVQVDDSLPATIKLALVEQALADSLRTQNHYAKLLNSYDGGARLTFETPQAWVSRPRRAA